MRIGVLTGGGDCPGLNPAIRGVVFKAAEYGDEVIGIKKGWLGMVEGLSAPLKLEDVDEIMGKGGTILGSTRTNPFKKEEDKKKMLDNIKKMRLEALVAIGGDDTLTAAMKLTKEGFPVVGVPKTMDNDISETDYTFGFDTSVSIAVDALEKLRDTAKSHCRVMVLEVMGRHAGWVALFTGLAGGADYILIPEEKVDLEKMYQVLKTVYARKGYGLVVVSEGIEIPGMKGAEAKADGFGHELLKEKGVGSYIASQIEKNTGFETRYAVIGHIQRGGPPTVFDRMLALRLGVKAVEMLHEGKAGMMASLRGNQIVEVKLEDAVAKNKKVSEEWVKLTKVFYR
ncbi:MAG: ATP-dependent 6-phosphofructokinase [Thermoplasmata archaeon]